MEFHLSALLRCVASINHQSGSLHVAAHRRGEENDGVCHLVDHTQPLERCSLQVLAQVRIRWDIQVC